jgi:uncharacterized OB-fold protein
MSTTPAITSYPMPLPDELTQPFWDAAQHHKLVIQQCRACETFIHWPGVICPFCQSDDLGYTEVSGKATLYTYTVVVQSFHPGLSDLVPYTLVLVELVEQEGLRMVSRLIDCPEDELQVGMPVEAVFVDVAPALRLPLFRRAGK